ncbi:MAG TPA: RNase J family beta-CASP ribonuclease [Actinobacteria bacterium]|nr:RNase J family beta-CASP ribonuclease [Actinomycetota bacterium]
MNYPHPELAAPPALAPGALRIVALGGLGEVGRNMAVFEIDGRLLIIDCGVLFPEDAQPGVDLILPDFTALADRYDDIDAVVLTHGHEDHIGALPYLLRQRADILLIGSRLTLALVAAKLKEHRITPTLQEVREGEVLQVGPFSCEFIAVNHSIPDSLAVAVTTSAGVVVHTGDFKMDQMPLDGRITDLAALARIGQAGVDLLMVDSTNAEVPGFVPSERDIAPALDRAIATAPRRVIVASFASHVHRIQQVLDAAMRHGRKVTFVGRSMVRNMAVARDLGYLQVPDGLVVDLDAIESLRDDQVVLVCTGSQGEPMAALSRMANRDHQILIGTDDTVVLASSLIPGNENAVTRVINGLMRLGATVVHKGNAMVHVSGHAAAGELAFLYNTVQPRHVMPVHGEWRHLRANADIAQRTGVAADRVLLCDDGMVVDLIDGQAAVTGKVECGYVYVDGKSIGEVGEELLKDRRTLRDEGFISVIVVVDTANGTIVSGPEVLARGFSGESEILDPVRPKITQAVEAALANGIADTHQLQQVVRRATGQWVSQAHRRRPMIVPVVLEV